MEAMVERVYMIPRAAAACATMLGATSMASSERPLGIQREGRWGVSWWAAKEKAGLLNDGSTGYRPQGPRPAPHPPKQQPTACLSPGLRFLKGHSPRSPRKHAFQSPETLSLSCIPRALRMRLGARSCLPGRRSAALLPCSENTAQGRDGQPLPPSPSPPPRCSSDGTGLPTSGASSCGPLCLNAVPQGLAQQAPLPVASPVLDQQETSPYSAPHLLLTHSTNHSLKVSHLPWFVDFFTARVPNYDTHLTRQGVLISVVTAVSTGPATAGPTQVNMCWMSE